MEMKAPSMAKRKLLTAVMFVAVLCAGVLSACSEDGTTPRAHAAGGAGIETAVGGNNLGGSSSELGGSATSGGRDATNGGNGATTAGIGGASSESGGASGG